MSVATYIIGYLFEQADKAITKAREGEYAASGYVPALATSPGNGYFVILRTVKPSAKLGKIATVADFINEAPGGSVTPGSTLHQQVRAWRQETSAQWCGIWRRRTRSRLMSTSPC